MAAGSRRRDPLQAAVDITRRPDPVGTVQSDSARQSHTDTSPLQPSSHEVPRGRRPLPRGSDCLRERRHSATCSGSAADGAAVPAPAGAAVPEATAGVPSPPLPTEPPPECYGPHASEHLQLLQQPHERRQPLPPAGLRPHLQHVQPALVQPAVAAPAGAPGPLPAALRGRPGALRSVLSPG